MRVKKAGAELKSLPLGRVYEQQNTSPWDY
jgi:hypothetical protein